MDKEEFKEGKHYNLKLKCILTAEKVIVFSTESGDHIPVRLCDIECVSPITPSEPPTLVGTPPTHDPCRKFRKGDKVQIIEWNGRNPFDTHHGLKLNPGEVHIVLDDEYERNEVYVGMSAADEEQSVVHACNLELVSPVEELSPYTVRHNEAHAAWSIYGPFDLSAVNYFYGPRYPYTPKTARAAAEAECARLNSEYRKEQN